MKKIEKYLLWPAVIAVMLLCFYALSAWLYTFWHPNFANKTEAWADFGTYVGGVLSPLLAGGGFIGLVVTIRQQQRSAEKQKSDADSDNYFKHAVQSLDRAFCSLCPNASCEAPVRDRMAWLTCARLLLAAKNAAQRISPDSEGILALYNGEEEYWRQRFYELLAPHSPNSVGGDQQFFQPDGANLLGIEERSIKVIYEFSRWPQGKIDPMHAVAPFTREEAENMPIGMNGVSRYILSNHRFYSDT